MILVVGALGRLGGTIAAGEDSGFIYQMYGFGLIRTLELHQEAGFHPLKIIQHATGNNAAVGFSQDLTWNITVE